MLIVKSKKINSIRYRFLLYTLIFLAILPK